MEIENLTHDELIAHFKDAICDDHYNPNDKPYNASVFTLQELEAEIFKRLSNN